MKAANRLCALGLAALASLSVLLLQCGPPLPDAAPELRREEAPLRPFDQVEPDLKSAEWSVRSNAILEIMRGEYRQATPALLRLLESDPHPAVRQTAALALGQFKERRAGPLIARLLRTDRAVTADYLVDALVRLGDPANAGAIVPLLNSENEQLRLTAVQALVDLKASHEGGAILALARANQDPSKTRMFAMALGQLQIKSAEPYLLQRARAEEPGPNLAAAYLALGRIQSRAAVPILVRAVAADFDKGRENAADALIDIGDRSANDDLFALLVHDRSAVRYSAAKAIAGIPDERSGPRALAALEAKHPLSTGPAAHILGRIKYAPARAAIEARFLDRQAPAREELGQALGWLGDPASAPALLRVLTEPDGEGRYGAAWSLGVLQIRSAAPALRAATKSSDRKLALLSVEALAALRDPESLGDLERLVYGRRDLAFQATEAIGDIPGERAQKILIDLLGSGDLELEIAAARGLGRRKEASSAAPLIAALEEDRPPEVQNALLAALREVTGLKFETRGQWIHWRDSGRGGASP